ncbi:hypothetical protein OH77DRAFT_1435295 [Trametes cingulata]|nr:hypothetical protein OH77DRAFT_1435295 [Trametes cingulata]
MSESSRQDNQGGRPAGDTSSPNGLAAARDALDAAAQLKEPNRAGKLEREFVDLAHQATDSNDAFKSLLDGVHTLIHTLPPLVRALDAVGQIHPFLAGGRRPPALLVFILRMLM